MDKLGLVPVAASYIEVDADGKPQMMLKESAQTG